MNNEQYENKMNNATAFTTVSKRMKYLETNLTKEVQD